jgi:uncharacterized membrane protein HdeD (DUF308 family)
VSTPTSESPQHALVRRARLMFLVEGIVLLLLGAAAIILPMTAALALTILLGWLFVFAGIVGLFGTFGTRGMPGFTWSFLSALVALVAGGVLIGWPVGGVRAIALVLAIFFILDGFSSIMFALEHRRQLTGRSNWILASGVVTLLLGVFILGDFPATAAVLGILVGLDMIVAGGGLVAIATSLRVPD